MDDNDKLILKCYSCDITISPENPAVWWGIPTYCHPCFDRIARKEKRWKGLQYYDRTGEEYPK